jgi:hypothetical protein
MPALAIKINPASKKNLPPMIHGRKLTTKNSSNKMAEAFGNGRLFGARENLTVFRQWSIFTPENGI